MTGTVTFNYLKGGIVGHVSVTLSDGASAMTLSSSADISGLPLGVYSTRHEQFRQWASTEYIRKSVVVDEATYTQVKAYFDAMRETRSDYGYLFGTNCLDFTEEVYTLIGGEGSVANMFTHAELSGPLAGLVLQWRGGGAHASSALPPPEVAYSDQVDADFGVSGGIVLLATVAFALLLARPPRALWQRIRGAIASDRASAP